MEETISLKEIFDILRKHLASIFIATFVGLALAGVVTFFVLTPKYSSQAQLIVTLPQNETTNTNDVNTNLQMINTYKELVTGDLVINQVRDRLASEYDIEKSVQTLKDAIEVTQTQNSLMFSIKATDTSSVYAANIANTTASVFQENAKDVLSVDKISIISNAQASTTPVSPNNKLNLMIGVGIGLLIGFGIAFLLELLDRTVKDNKFVTENLGFIILGTVPQMTPKELNATIQNKPVTPIIKKTIKNDKTAESRRSRSRI